MTLWSGLNLVTLAMTNEMVKPTGPTNVSITRGDAWLAALDPTVGSEIQKTRPCVIISPPEDA